MAAEQSASPASGTRTRVLVYALAFLVTVLLFIVGFGQQGSNAGDAHLLLSVLSICAAAFTGAFALIRYYVRKRYVYLWVGVGLLGTALLEAYHAVAVGDYIPVHVSAEAAAVEPWSWLVARTALALYLLLSWRAVRQRTRHTGRPQFPAWSVYLIVGVSAFACITALILLPPVGQFVSAEILGRPFELLPGVLFLAALIGFLVDGDWRTSSFEHSLVVSLILASAAHLLLLPFSAEPYDPLFYFGVLVQVASYLVIAAGLLTSTYRVFRLAEQRRMESLRATFDLNKEREHVIQSLEELRVKERQLRTKVAELETTRSAVLNIMEDLDVEKQKLAQEKAKDEAILASVGEGLVVTDSKRRITYLNAAAEQILGYKSGDVLGKIWPELVSPTTEEGALIARDDLLIVRALRTLKIKSTVKPQVFSRRDGTKLVAGSTVAPVILADEPIGAIVVFRDVTREREIDKAKSEFVSLASHQLRTPLSTIKWYVEMMLDGDAGKLSAALKDYLGEVAHANERMVDLVNALLNVSRVELGTFAVQPQQIDVVATAKSVVSEVAPQASVKKIKVREEYDELPILPADPNLLRIVFQNLITNAIKYTPKRGSVTVRLRRAAAGSSVAGRKVSQNSILIQVADTGYGIPTAAQPKIFTKLFRADNVREREPDGTGLGLYIVKSVVDHTDGDIWFDSTEGKGTTFYVLLPIAGMHEKKGAKQLT